MESNCNGVTKRETRCDQQHTSHSSSNNNNNDDVINCRIEHAGSGHVTCPAGTSSSSTSTRSASPDVMTSDSVQGPVRRTAAELAAYVISDVTSRSPSAAVTSSHCRHVDTLLRVVHELLSKSGDKLRHMADQVLACNTDGSAAGVCREFDAVVRQMYADGRYSWGRLTAVYAFAGCLAVRWVEDGRWRVTDDQLEDLEQRVGSVIADRLGAWIERQTDDWDDFERFFERPEPAVDRGVLWRGLVAAFVELGTTAIVGVH